jgi:hypothetical protein
MYNRAIQAFLLRPLFRPSRLPPCSFFRSRTATDKQPEVGCHMAIENERLIPQQSASTVTNLDDIETSIRSKETTEKSYLTAIDLPVRERKKVVQELSHMGITAGSLFPGLDGACEEMRERNFDI